MSPCRHSVVHSWSIAATLGSCVCLDRRNDCSRFSLNLTELYVVTASRTNRTLFLLCYHIKVAGGWYFVACNPNKLQSVRRKLFWNLLPRNHHLPVLFKKKLKIYDSTFIPVTEFIVSWIDTNHAYHRIAYLITTAQYLELGDTPSAENNFKRMHRRRTCISVCSHLYPKSSANISTIVYRVSIVLLWIWCPHEKNKACVLLQNQSRRIRPTFHSFPYIWSKSSSRETMRFLR